jgi:hypothetical protein
MTKNSKFSDSDNIFFFKNGVRMAKISCSEVFPKHEKIKVNRSKSTDDVSGTADDVGMTSC